MPTFCIHYNVPSAIEIEAETLEEASSWFEERANMSGWCIWGPVGENEYEGATSEPQIMQIYEVADA